MPVDAAVASLLEQLKAQGFESFQQLGVKGSRALIDTFTELQKPPREIVRVEEVQYGGDPEQRLRVYVPEGSGSLPVVVYTHGGGFIGAGLAVVDEPARALANDLGAIVVTVTYRKAPEHKFPAAHDDAWSAFQWVTKHVEQFGGDLGRMAVMGDSVGGNIAAGVVVRARNTGLTRLAAQVLIYPLVDPAAETDSRREYAEGYVISTSDLGWFGQHYVSSPADATDPRLSLTALPTLEGLPPTLVLTNECDPMRDEAEAFAEQLGTAGVDVETTRFPGLVHAVYWMSGAVPRSAEYHQRIVEFLRSRLA
jgi:acetyl esterase